MRAPAEPVDARVLADLATGERGEVVGLTAEGAQRRRLLDLGLVPGTAVEAVHRAAAGDPTAYRFRGVTIALRSTDAALVRIRHSRDTTNGAVRNGL